jgi:hypothetical protein
MRNMFDGSAAAEFKARVERLGPDSRRQWGTMTVQQAVEHLSRGLELAMGEAKPPRALAGRLFGWAIKPLALGNDKPMRRNTPTIDGMRVTDGPELERARARLVALIDRFVAAGPAGCTEHPHAFFGRLTSEEWSILMYKHLDHHLRQFGV